MQQVKTRMKKVVAVLMAFALCFCFTPMTSWAAGASSGETFTLERVQGGTQKDVVVGGEQRVVYCMQYDNLWPITEDGYNNPRTHYWEASDSEMMLDAAQLSTIRKVLFAGYPYNGVGALKPLYAALGSYADEPAADLTQDVIWALMAKWGISGNSHYDPSVKDPDEILDGWVESYNNLMDFVENGSLPSAAPESFAPELKKQPNFVEKDGVWTAGPLSISDPDGYKLMYNVTLPDGVILLDKDHNEVYPGWDYVDGEFVDLGYTVFGEEDFYLQTEDPNAVDGKKVGITASVKIPTDVKQYMTDETGFGNKNDGQGYVQHPFQNMLSIGISSRTYVGSATLGAPLSIPVTKQWYYENPEDDKPANRPVSVEVDLYANNDVVKTMHLFAFNNWHGVFENLPRLDASGVEIEYTVKEKRLPDYEEKSIVGDASKGFTITNEYRPETTVISGTKTWNHEGNTGAKPSSIEVTVHSDVAGIPSRSQIVSGTGDVWSYSFTDLPKYYEGKAVVYSITEAEVSDYTVRVDGYNLVNTYDPTHVAIEVNKVWSDEENQDGLRPSSVTVALVRENGEAVLDGNGDPITLKLSKDNRWSGVFEDLPRKEGDQPIQYKVQEQTAVGYQAPVITGDMTSGFVITNAHVPETTAVSVKKVWNDNGDKYQLRPDKIIAKLYVKEMGTDDDAVLESEVELNQDNDWTHVWADLPKYADGKELVYSIDEQGSHGYESVVTASENDPHAFTITNTFKEVEVNGVKHWLDDDNALGNRPESISLKLENHDGQVLDTKTVMPDANGEWRFDFDTWPAYDKDKEILYYVIEEPVDGYTSEYAQDSHNITNVYDKPVTEISVKKVWEDQSNADKVRPESVTVKLLENGKETGFSQKLSDENDWFVDFSDLPVYKNRAKVVYTVEEVDVPAGYVSKVSGDAGEGFVITNTRDKSKDDPDKPLDPVEPTDPNGSNGSSDATISSQTGDTASNAVPGLIALVIASAATLVFARRRMLKS